MKKVTTHHKLNFFNSGKIKSVIQIFFIFCIINSCGTEKNVSTPYSKNHNNGPKSNNAVAIPKKNIPTENSPTENSPKKSPPNSNLTSFPSYSPEVQNYNKFPLPDYINQNEFNFVVENTKPMIEKITKVITLNNEKDSKFNLIRNLFKDLDIKELDDEVKEKVLELFVKNKICQYNENSVCKHSMCFLGKIKHEDSLNEINNYVLKKLLDKTKLYLIKILLHTSNPLQNIKISDKNLIKIFDEMLSQSPINLHIIETLIIALYIYNPFVSDEFISENEPLYFDKKPLDMNDKTSLSSRKKDIITIIEKSITANILDSIKIKVNNLSSPMYLDKRILDTTYSNNFIKNKYQLLQEDSYGLVKTTCATKNSVHNNLCKNTDSNYNHKLSDCEYVKMNNSDLLLSLIKEENPNDKLLKLLPQDNVSVSTLKETFPSNKKIAYVLDEASKISDLSSENGYEIYYIGNNEQKSNLNGGIKAFVTFYEEIDFIKVSVLYTEAKSRKKGYAKILFDLLKDRAKKYNKKIFLITDGETNRIIYSKLGFKTFDDNSFNINSIKSKYNLPLSKWPFNGGTIQCVYDPNEATEIQTNI